MYVIVLNHCVNGVIVSHRQTRHFVILLQLLQKVWSGRYTLIHPSQFKQTLGFHHSQFEDFRQVFCANIFPETDVYRTTLAVQLHVGVQLCLCVDLVFMFAYV